MPGRAREHSRYHYFVEEETRLKQLEELAKTTQLLHGGTIRADVGAHPCGSPPVMAQRPQTWLLLGIEPQQRQSQEEPHAQVWNIHCLGPSWGRRSAKHLCHPPSGVSCMLPTLLWGTNITACYHRTGRAGRKRPPGLRETRPVPCFFMFRFRGSSSLP